MVFTGFSRASATFFEQLAANNNRDYFTQHKAEYVRTVRQPLEDLLGEVEAKYGSGHIMRPNRDVRFSADKTPYRLNGSLWAGEVGGVYLTVSAAGIEAGGGLYEPSRDQLLRARQAIDAVPLAAAELAGIVSSLEAAGYEIAGPSLATAPRGYDRSHPSIDLLRLRHYAATTKLPIDSSPEDIWRAWDSVQPLIDWASSRVGKALAWP